MTHIAGACITYNGRYMRQRCSWCGEILVDYDLARVMVAEGSGGPSGFEAGRLVRVDGNCWSVLPDTDKLPEDACAVLETTR